MPDPTPIFAVDPSDPKYLVYDPDNRVFLIKVESIERVVTSKNIVFRVSSHFAGWLLTYIIHYIKLIIVLRSRSVLQITKRIYSEYLITSFIFILHELNNKHPDLCDYFTSIII